ncbi:uncharacterized protein LOC108100338 [Drosophila ficusphila]|uniref:uncharacterized protein LOC108100338 n=1 Tax=Drosophila ficusphila TaxID=30025 RepID=UPI0007E89576|nr:uncharacterized protein LOC108100338 [Drosophila ficusphila]
MVSPAKMLLQYLIFLFLMDHRIQAKDSFVKPSDLAEFVDRIGRFHRLTAITLVNSLGSIDPSYLDELHRLLMCNSSNHFHLVPQMTASDQDLSPLLFSALQDEETLYLVFARDSSDAVVQLHAERARGRRYSKTIFLLRKKESLLEVKCFFQHIWKLQFRSALVVVAARKFYQMDPYPDIRVIHMRRLSSYDPHHLFPPPSRRNLQGYRLRLPVQKDIPNTFWYHNRKEHFWKLDGSGGIMIYQFTKLMNLTMDLYSLEVNGSTLLNTKALGELIVRGEVELSPHLHNVLQPNHQLDYSYPSLISSRCFMIPLDNEISRSLYVVLPFSYPVWLCLLFTLLVLEFVFVRRLMPDIQLWWIVGVPGAGGARRGDLKPGRCMIAALIVFGIFMVVQSYSTKISSFLAVTLTSSPTSNLEELFRLPNRILALPGDVDAIVGSLGHAEQFAAKFNLTDLETFTSKRIAMDPEYIYPISHNRWRFFDMQQRFLKKKRFFFSSICHGSFPYQYQLRVDSHLKDALHRFLLHTSQGGLQNRWLETCFRRAHRMGYLRDFSTLAEMEKNLRVRPLALNLLAPAFSLFLCGLAGSGIAFLVEIRMSFGCRRKPLKSTNRNPGD